MLLVLEPLILLIGPGVCAGLAAAKPKKFLWPAMVSLVAMVFRVWPDTVSPEGEAFLMFIHLIIAVSAVVGLFAGLLCTGRQHQESEN